jgi:ankyrin repeat protein
LALACGWNGAKPSLKKLKEVLKSFPFFLNESLDEDERTALMIACWYNHPIIVTYLLSKEELDVNKVGDKAVQCSS